MQKQQCIRMVAIALVCLAVFCDSSRSGVHSKSVMAYDETYEEAGVTHGQLCTLGRSSQDWIAVFRRDYHKVLIVDNNHTQ